MGTSGRRGLARLIGGSVAEGCSARAVLGARGQGAVVGALSDEPWCGDHDTLQPRAGSGLRFSGRWRSS
ncbi:MAG: hypothetical protein ABIQ79_06565 [Nitrospiraceae bacterium]